MPVAIPGIFRACPGYAGVLVQPVERIHNSDEEPGLGDDPAAVGELATPRGGGDVMQASDGRGRGGGPWWGRIA